MPRETPPMSDRDREKQYRIVRDAKFAAGPHHAMSDVAFFCPTEAWHDPEWEIENWTPQMGQQIYGNLEQGIKNPFDMPDLIRRDPGRMLGTGKARILGGAIKECCEECLCKKKGKGKKYEALLFEKMLRQMNKKKKH